MRRILCTVEYDGTVYAGWQRQLNGLAVQQVLEEALARATGKPVAITGASRTDAGVHARGQAFHFDTESSIPPEKYPFVLNTMLPRDIRVHTGQEVPAEFHARFMTAGKRYTYRICNSRHGTALGRNLSAHVPLPPPKRCWVRTISPPFRPPAARQRPPCAPCAWRRSHGRETT